MPIKNYSTTKDPIDTIAEIEKILVKNVVRVYPKNMKMGFL